MDEPATKRAVSFFDGQNLFRRAKQAFDYFHPNFDPLKLTDAVCQANGWERRGVRFYTGTSSQAEDPLWNAYWANRLRSMSRSGILVTSRPLMYQEIEIPTEDGGTAIELVAHEKGIDIRLALDAVRLTLNNQLDVAIIFSQDQDLSELAKELKEISPNGGSRSLAPSQIAQLPLHGAGLTVLTGSQWTRLSMTLALISTTIDLERLLADAD